MTHEQYNFKFNPAECEACGGHCCTGESGYIYVTKDEIKAIAEVLNIDINELRVKYLFKKGYKYSICLLYTSPSPRDS